MRDLKDLTTKPSHYTEKKAETKRGKMMVQDKKAPDFSPRCLFLSHAHEVCWRAVPYS